jgi:hypothetical protein
VNINWNGLARSAKKGRPKPERWSSVDRMDRIPLGPDGEILFILFILSKEFILI